MIELTIPGKPLGKQRARTGKGFSFTPAQTVNYETLVKQLYSVNRFPMFEGYIKMEIDAYYDIPKSTSKKKMEQMLKHEIRPDKKPDADNIAKIVCDALNKIAYHDDDAIVDLSVRKFYAVQPCVIVRISKI